MQALKKKASFLFGSSKAGGGNAAASTESSGALTKTFIEASAQEKHCRRLLLHQEAVARVAEGYASSILNVLTELAIAHETLQAGLQQAADLVSEDWTYRAGELGDRFRKHADRGREDLSAPFATLAKARAEHKEAVRLASEAEVAAKKHDHYTKKVERLREAVQQARRSLGEAALEPKAGGDTPQKGNSSTSLLSKSLDKRKTNNFDLQQGRLMRNEEKLSVITARFQGIRAQSVRQLIGCVTQGRRQVFDVLEEVLRLVIDDLLPGVHGALEGAAQATRKACRTDASGGGGYPTVKRIADQPAGELPMFAVGEVVTICNLNSAAQYNGTSGTILSVRADGRVEVELAVDAEASSAAASPAGQGISTTKILAVKPENVCRAAVAASSLADRCDAEFVISGAETLALDSWIAGHRKVLGADESSGDDSCPPAPGM
eukprot:TRINITY_DN35744_c0_g1_i1.p1 TRINITY_DN35744_c0_g1~~TRINITY_DN35744_c0_g1_i1.p1  ORF type:complete len:435 (-),score=123.79 TRINITY_DN35744_c0_g1_i1:104-1408(-)